MKTKEEIITSMCYTYRREYGLEEFIGFKFDKLMEEDEAETSREEFLYY